MSKEITLFRSEAELSRFTRRNKMTFATAILVDEPDAKERALDCRKHGKAVVRLENYALNTDAFLIFHK